MLADDEQDPNSSQEDHSEREEEAEYEEAQVVSLVVAVLPRGSAAHPVVLDDVLAPAQEWRQGQEEAVGPGGQYEAVHHLPAVQTEVILK